MNKKEVSGGITNTTWWLYTRNGKIGKTVGSSGIHSAEQAFGGEKGDVRGLVGDRKANQLHDYGR